MPRCRAEWECFEPSRYCRWVRAGPERPPRVFAVTRDGLSLSRIRRSRASRAWAMVTLGALDILRLLGPLGLLDILGLLSAPGTPPKYILYRSTPAALD